MQSNITLNNISVLTEIVIGVLSAYYTDRVVWNFFYSVSIFWYYLGIIYYLDFIIDFNFLIYIKISNSFFILFIVYWSLKLGLLLSLKYYWPIKVIKVVCKI